MSRDRWRFSPAASHTATLVNSRWQATNAQVTPASFFEAMRDGTHQVEKLGKSRDDIGGPLDHVKISLTLGDWNPRTMTPNFGGYSLRSLVLPPLNQLGGSHGSVAAAAWGRIRDAQYLTGASPIVSDIINQGHLLGFIPGGTMDSDGATAINRVRPTTPAVDLATSVAELVSERQFFGVPTRNGGTRGDVFRWDEDEGLTVPIDVTIEDPSRFLSGEYLNYQLAVSPLMGTFGDLRSAQQNKDQLLAQYERDAGRLVRRRYTFPTITDDTTVTTGDKFPISWDPGSWVSTEWFSGVGTVTSRQRLQHERWFSGAFTYAPPPEGWRKSLYQMDVTHGIGPGIDTAWELVPFSFVVDYFSNVGDVLGNLSSFIEDGLVMPFGYMMSRKKYDFDVTWVGPITSTYRYPPAATLTATLSVEVNQRRAATPFGFGFSSDPSVRQMSILAALGMSAFR
jgi:hypothetical protein